MSKNIHLRVASKLFYDDNHCNVQDMVDELSDITADSIDFTFAHDCEIEEKQKFINEFIPLFCKSLKKRFKNANI